MLNNHYRDGDRVRYLEDFQERGVGIIGGDRLINTKDTEYQILETTDERFTIL